MYQHSTQTQAPRSIQELQQWLDGRLKSIEKKVMRLSLAAKGMTPRFLSLPETGEFLSISPKTVSNELSAGTFPVKPIYRKSKPLFPYAALLEYARALEQDSSEPAKKRGRKRVCKDEGQEPSRIAELKAIKNPAGRRGGDGLTSRGGESQ